MIRLIFTLTGTRGEVGKDKHMKVEKKLKGRKNQEFSQFLLFKFLGE